MSRTTALMMAFCSILLWPIVWRSMLELFLIMGKFLLSRLTNWFWIFLTSCDPKAALPTFYDKSPLDTAVEHYFMKYKERYMKYHDVKFLHRLSTTTEEKSGRWCESAWTFLKKRNWSSCTRWLWILVGSTMTNPAKSSKNSCPPCPLRR